LEGLSINVRDAPNLGLAVLNASPCRGDDFPFFTNDKNRDLVGPENRCPVSQPVNFVRVMCPNFICCTAQMTPAFSTADERV